MSWYRSREAELTIHWSTENELDIVGFNLYRSDAANGEYVKLNDRPIPAAADPLLGSEYSYIDANVIPGRTYYYILEIIDRNGQIRRRDPITITAE